MSDQEILTAALRLPATKRERIAEAIIGSIKSPSRRHIQTLWGNEAESRVDALLSGKLGTVPGKEVLAYRGRR